MWKGLLFEPVSGMHNVPIHLDFKGTEITGVADPVESKNRQGIPLSYIIYLQGRFIGVISCEKNGWVMDRPVDNELVESLGEYLHAWYE